jgi:hypothetical protein
VVSVIFLILSWFQMNLVLRYNREQREWVSGNCHSNSNQILLSDFNFYTYLKVFQFHHFLDVHTLNMQIPDIQLAEPFIFRANLNLAIKCFFLVWKLNFLSSCWIIWPVKTIIQVKHYSKMVGFSRDYGGHFESHDLNARQNCPVFKSWLETRSIRCLDHFRPFKYPATLVFGCTLYTQYTQTGQVW